MKKSLFLIIGSVIVGGGLLLLLKKKKEQKQADQKQQEADAKIAEEQLKKDFDLAVQTTAQAQAEAMNIEQINEKKAKSLLSLYDAILQQKKKLGSVPASDKRLISFNSLLKQLESEINKLGYNVMACVNCINGSSIMKK